MITLNIKDKGSEGLLYGNDTGARSIQNSILDYLKTIDYKEITKIRTIFKRNLEMIEMKDQYVPEDFDKLFQTTEIVNLIEFLATQNFTVAFNDEVLRLAMSFIQGFTNVTYRLKLDDLEVTGNPNVVDQLIGAIND